jgi:hypothetical protein
MALVVALRRAAQGAYRRAALAACVPVIAVLSVPVRRSDR